MTTTTNAGPKFTAPAWAERSELDTDGAMIYTRGGGLCLVGVARVDEIEIAHDGTVSIAEGDTHVTIEGDGMVTLTLTEARQVLAALAEHLAAVAPLCPCGKPVGHLAAPSESAEWACRVAVGL